MSPDLRRASAGFRFAVAGLAVLVASCAPNTPLYSPQQSPGGHGYSDERLGPAEYQVTYTAPRDISLAVTRVQRRQEANERVDLAYDMALWRAAELALQNGYPAFDVIHRANDARITLEGDYWGYGPWGDPFFDRRFGYPYPYYPYRGPLDRYASIDARVTLTVKLEHQIRNGLFDAQGAIDKLKAHYPTALSPGQTL